VIHAVTAEMERLIESVQTIDIFVEVMDAATVPDPGVRSHMQAWSQRWRAAIRSHHIYIAGSKLYTMVITVANLVSGGSLTVHASRAAFEAALRVAVRGS
jgi:hypothetical protein